MIRDYATRQCGTGRRRRYSSNQSHAGLWLFTIFLFIMFTLGLVFLGKYHRHGSRIDNAKKGQKEVVVQKGGEVKSVRLPALVHQDNNNIEQEEHSVPKSSKVTTETKISPQFEFTTPQSLVQDAAQKIATESGAESKKLNAANVNKLEQDTGRNSEQYMLEVIKTKNRIVAEKMRARLALLGIESNIVTVKEQNTMYYKISLGPYDKQTAAVKQQLLKDNNI